VVGTVESVCFSVENDVVSQPAPPFAAVRSSTRSIRIASFESHNFRRPADSASVLLREVLFMAASHLRTAATPAPPSV
jgi:hypothetical protein